MEKKFSLFLEYYEIQHVYMHVNNNSTGSFIRYMYVQNMYKKKYIHI